jgi:hypothetical protein
VPVRQGLRVYFSKQNDVYEWVLRDLRRWLKKFLEQGARLFQ